ncbi:MAG: hypothetical protein WBZ04_06505 [Candidatus Nanopelagicales bacterium]
MEPVAVIFADLDFAVDEYRSGSTWDLGLLSGAQADVVPGAPIVVTDTSQAFLSTVTDIDDIGVRFAIQWDRPCPIPPAYRAL